jgi:hypothetical protein
MKIKYYGRITTKSYINSEIVKKILRKCYLTLFFLKDLNYNTLEESFNSLLSLPLELKDFFFIGGILLWKQQIYYYKI